MPMATKKHVRNRRRGERLCSWGCTSLTAVTGSVWEDGLDMGEDERGRSSHEELTKAPNQHYATMMSRSLSARCNVNA
jgi:hypothetical protein